MHEKSTLRELVRINSNFLRTYGCNYLWLSVLVSVIAIPIPILCFGLLIC